MSLVGFKSLISPVSSSGRRLSAIVVDACRPHPAQRAGVYRGAIGNSMGRASCFNFLAARFSLKVVCAGFLEAVSKLSQQDNEATELNKAEII